MTTTPVQVPGDPPPVILNQEPASTPPTPEPVLQPELTVVEPPAAPVDEFADMFAQFAREGEPPKPAAAAPASTPEPVPTPPPTAAPAAPAPGQPSPGPAPVVDPMERLADILTQRTQPQAPEPRQPQQPQPAPMFSPDEAQALQAFYQEWPEIAHAQELAIRAAVQQTTAHVFNEMAKFLGPKISLLDQLASNFQYDVIERRIPDYEAVQGRVAEWVRTQPGYLQAAYNNVMEQGTPDEVTDLIERYRQATGDAPAPNAPASAAPAPARTAPATLSPAARQAAARLAPVSGKRTGPTAVAPTSYEDSFDQWAKAG